MDAMTKLKKARVKLLTTSNPALVFMAHLACVPDKLDGAVDTACTDGTVIRWNPEFVDASTDAEVFGTLIHELLHVGLLHTVVACNYRAELPRLNVAADLAANSILSQAGIDLPEGALMPGVGKYAHLPHGLSLEQYLAELRKMDDQKQQQKQQGGGQGQGDGQQGQGDAQQGQGDGQQDGDSKPQPGAIEPAGSEAARNGEPASAAELASEVIRAQVKHAAGKLAGIASAPQHLRDAIEIAQQRKVDFRRVLKRFRSKLVRGGSDWSRLNRRLQAVGVSAARNRRRATGDVVVLLDVSGSMTAALVRCMGEIVNLFGNIDGNLHIWQHDTRVLRKDVWEHGKPLPEICRAGRGGTSHATAFAEIEASGIRPEVVICLSDLETQFPDRKPTVPVVWIATEVEAVQPPFGQLCHTVI